MNVRKIENFLLYIIFKLSLTRTKNLGEGRGMGAVKDSNGDDNENDSNKLTFTAVDWMKARQRGRKGF